MSDIRKRSRVVGDHKCYSRYTASNIMVPPYKDEHAFAEKVYEFIRKCEEEEEPLTLSGLLLHMNINGKKRLDEYREHVVFNEVVEWALQLIENGYEKQLVRGKNANGAIFALKQFGWHDKQDIHHSGEAVTPNKIEYVIKKAKK